MTAGREGRSPDGANVGVTVIIPSLNTRSMLETTLRTLSLQHGVSQHDVVVVDMSSSDGTVEMLEHDFPGVCLLRDAPNLGYGAAINAGAKATDSPWILASNSDLEFGDPSVVGELLACAEALPASGVLGPRLVGADGAPQRSAHELPGRMALPALFFVPLRYLGALNTHALGLLDETLFTSPTQVGWVSGAILLIRREAFDAVGGFDEHFFMNSEEVDLCERVIEAGFGVYFVPEVTVVHHGGASTPSGSSGLVWLAQGSARYTRKHFGLPTFCAAVGLSWLAYLSSVPVWFGRAIMGRWSFAAAWNETIAYARALSGATRG